MNKKYIIGIVIVIVVIGLVLIFASNQSAPQESASPTSQTAPQSGAVSATGNIDDIAAAALIDSNSDEPAAAESDQSLLSENDSAISGYGQSLDGATQ